MLKLIGAFISNTEFKRFQFGLKNNVIEPLF